MKTLEVTMLGESFCITIIIFNNYYSFLLFQRIETTTLLYKTWTLVSYITLNKFVV